MSVLCCRIPNFLVSLTYRQHSDWRERPLALLGADERVWATSPEARVSGVQLQMSPRQAQMRCPDVVLRPLDMAQCETEQNAFLHTLTETELPVETQTWGAAYVDMRAVTQHALTARSVCADLGKQVQRAMGETLRPSLGWDTSKFTARAAARYAKVGHLRLVAQSDESRFLNPLPIHLLPLSAFALQQLHWLGIRTLGQFAQLPPSAVLQRFGPAGKTAQQWAQGRDDRPVCANVRAPLPTMAVEFDPPTALHQAALDAILNSLRPHLRVLNEYLEGCRRLRVELHFDTGSARTIECVFIEPVSHDQRLRALLAYQLQTLNWPSELSSARITLLEHGELVTRQLSLFATDESGSSDHAPSPLTSLAQKLCGRYGGLLFKATLTDANHPFPERRMIYDALVG